MTQPVAKKLPSQQNALWSSLSSLVMAGSIPRGLIAPVAKARTHGRAATCSRKIHRSARELEYRYVAGGVSLCLGKAACQLALTNRQGLFGTFGSLQPAASRQQHVAL